MVLPCSRSSAELRYFADNLRNFSIEEQPQAAIKARYYCLCQKVSLNTFISLCDDHPAIEFAADALRHKLVGETTELDASEATHIGPSGDVTAP